MPLLEQVLEQNPTDVKLVYKNFPLSMHKFARSAAQAAMAANEQGKFWQFHDKLFENHRSLSDEKIEEIAKGLNLDMDKFNQDWHSQKIAEAVVNDLQEGLKYNVRGTPTIFINGRLLQNRSVKGFQDLIDKELAKERSAEKQ